jgi:Protein of unknown function (DUF1592)/Protein of unknown function (DUF1588)/Protein of unknown function (DUF1587)/Protein of unknown function (DUF1595)/Protein of unknown function (DUF1585)
MSQPVSSPVPHPRGKLLTRTSARNLQIGAGSVQAAAAIAKPFWKLALLAGGVLLPSACVGEVDSSNPVSNAGVAGMTSASAGSSGVGVGGQPAVTCVGPAPGAAPIRRLTRFELNNTLRDLLGDTTKAGDQLPPELKGNGFSNDAASLSTSRVLVDAYRAIADELASTATKDAAALAKLSSCDVAALGEEACAHAFVSDFGKKAFRRPLSDAESAALYGVYVAGKEGATHAAGLKAVIEMALQSPQFLYRVETGVAVPGKPVWRPTSSEMATRLSYLLWGSTPDPGLLDLAAQHQLDTAEQVKAEAEQMLQDSRARDVLRYFTDTLYGIGGLDGLERNAEAFPTFNASLGPLFRQETERFIEDVVWNGAGDFATLFNAPYTFVNGPLAAFYGLPGITGDAFQRVERDPARRLGLLTHASVLSSTTPGSRNNPVVRGKFIFEEILCGNVPSPPVGLNVKEPPADPTRTTRERFTAHREMEPCKSCHVMLDPIGFGLENFDGVGLWRDTENGKPVDASGELPQNVDIAGAFLGPAELAKKIAGSQDAQRCFADKWQSFAYGRVPGDDDACSKSQLENAFREANGNVKALLLAATQTDAFLYLPQGS